MSPELNQQYQQHTLHLNSVFSIRPIRIESTSKLESFLTSILTVIGSSRNEIEPKESVHTRQDWTSIPHSQLHLSRLPIKESINRLLQVSTRTTQSIPYPFRNRFASEDGVLVTFLHEKVLRNHFAPHRHLWVNTNRQKNAYFILNFICKRNKSVFNCRSFVSEWDVRIGWPTA